MISIDQYYLIRKDKQLSKKEKVKQLMDLLAKERFYFIGGKLYCDIDFSQFELQQMSHWIIKVNNNNDYFKKNKNEEILDKYYQYKEVVDKLCKAINSICIKQDRIVFVERFLFHEKINTITNKHLMSQKSFYQSIEAAIEDFCDCLKIF